MSERGYWNRIRNSQLSRRAMLGASARAGIGAAGLALVGCGDDDDGDEAAQQQAQPAAAAAAQQQQQQAQQPAQSAAAQQQDQQQQAAVAAVDTEAPTRGGTLRLGWDLALSGFRGPYAQSQHGAFHTPVWDTLIRYPYDSLEPEARLAESWEFNGDQTILTVHLRPGLEFHNARPIDAQAVKASFEAILDPDTPNSQVRGPLTKYVERIEAVDKTTLNFHLLWPGTTIFDVLNFGHVHDPDEIKSLEGYQNVAASGPFKFNHENNIVDQFAQVDRHENFYDPAYLDSITYQTFADRDAMTLALLADEIDVTPAFPAERYSEFVENDDYNVVLGVARGLWVFGMVSTSRDGGHEIFDDPRVRRALYRVIDRERIVSDVFAGLEQPANVLWPSYSPGYSETYDRDYFNIEEAKQLLIDAGYPDGTPEIEVVTWRGALDNAIAQIIINDAQQAGLNIKIDLQDRPAFLEKFLAGQHQAYINTYGFHWIHPQTLPVMNYQMRIPNSCAYASPEYQAMIDGWATADSDAERQSLLDTFNDILDREPWVAPIATASGIWAAHNRLQNLDWAVSGYNPSMEKFWLKA